MKNKLSTENFKKEGWELFWEGNEDGSNNYNKIINSKRISLTHNEETNVIRIYEHHGEKDTYTQTNLYFGKCLNIKDFKIICKSLNIK